MPYRKSLRRPRHTVAPADLTPADVLESVAGANFPHSSAAPPSSPHPCGAAEHSTRAAR